MNLRYIIYILAFFPHTSFSQEKMTDKIDSLKYVNDMPYICHDNVDNNNILSSSGCGDKRFWSVVKLKQKAIPLLLDKLSDTTITVAIVPIFGYNYSVADIAYVALEEIIHDIPTFELLGIEFDQKGCGYCSYWQHLNINYKNRTNFKIAVQNWYYSNKDRLVWVESNYFSSCDCRGTHPNNGHYEIIK